MEKMNGQSKDVIADNIDKLKSLFPECVSEGKVDFDRLRAVLDKDIILDEDHYSFRWHGKEKALRIAQTPTTATLRPCPEESRDWDDTGNLFIEGDNLEVLKLLQKSYYGQVKMIYIDPPYNTGGEFIYPDNYRDNLNTYLAYTGQVDSEGYKFSKSSESEGKYHTNWLNMMYPRLRLARSLLCDDGVIFISIDDNEQDNLKKLCNEVFGEENFVANFIWQDKYTTTNDKQGISSQTDYVICYAKSADSYISNKLPLRKDYIEKHYKNPDNDPNGRYMTVQMYKKKNPKSYEIISPTGKKWVMPWNFSKETMKTMIDNNQVYWGKDGNSSPRKKVYLKDAEGVNPTNLILLGKDVGFSQDGGERIEKLFGNRNIFLYPKPPSLISHLAKICSGENDIILDFFAGSGTTADAIMQLNAEDGGNRRFICTQLPEKIETKSKEQKDAHDFCMENKLAPTIAEISKERIRRAGDKIMDQLTRNDLDTGFRVFKLDSSNFKMWDPTFETLEQDLINAVDHIKHDRSPEDLLYEVLLKIGLELDLSIEKKKIGGKTIHIIGNGALLICFEKNLTAKIAESIIAIKDELQPEIMRVVFRDDCFPDDVVKANTLLTLKQHKITDVRSI